MQKPEHIAGVILFIGILILYSFTVGQYHVSIADSDELTLIGYTLGVAHAPGYPVYILILYAFTHWLPFGSIAFRANMSSAFFQSVTVLLMYLNSLEILGFIKLRGVTKKVKRKKYKTFFYYFQEKDFRFIKIGISVLSALLLAFSFLFWLYADVAEVFALNDVFVLLLVLLTLKLTHLCLNTKYMSYDHYLQIQDSGDTIEKESLQETEVARKKIYKMLLFIAVVAGLALSHLQTIILIYPAILVYIVYILLRTKYLRSMVSVRRLSAYLISMVLSFALPFFLLFWYNSLHTPVSWGFTSTLHGLITYILRQNYASASTGNAYTQNTSTQAAFASVMPYWTSVYNDFLSIPIAAMATGVGYLAFRNRRICIYILSLALCAGFFFVLYVGYPFTLTDIVKHYGDIAILQRQFIMGDVLLSLFIPVGFYAAFRLLYRAFSFKSEKGTYSKMMSILTVMLLLIIGLVMEIRSNYGNANLHTFSYLQRYSYDALTSASPHAVVICFSDISCFSDLYQQNIIGTRKDITIVPADYSLRQYYLDHVSHLQEFYYKTTPDNMADIISWSLYEKRNVYVSDISSAYISYIGLNGDTFFLIPNGYLQKVAVEVPNRAAAYSYNAVTSYAAYFHSFTKNGTSYKNYWDKLLEGFFARPLYSDAYLYLEEGQLASTKNLARQIIAIDPTDPSYQFLEKNIITYKYPSGGPQFYPGLHTHSSSEYYGVASEEYLKKHNLANAEDLAHRAVLEDPTNINARLFLAELYQNDNKVNFAKIEYENVLKLDPNNPTAKKYLKSIS